MSDTASQRNKPEPSIIIDARRKKKELRRVRGEMSCSECRRLKIRCDRKIPCTSCIRRGYSSICPNGTQTMTTIDTNKLLLDLDKAQMRVRQLEDALKASHAHHSSSPHPLLVSGNRQDIDGSSSASATENNDPLEIFGTLSVTDGGESRFLGPSATTERFLLSEITHIDHADNNPEVPSLLSYFGKMWPFTPTIHSRLAFQELIESQLPPYGRASSLCEAYLQNLAWFLQPISRVQIMEELLPAVYKRKGASAKTNPRDLALLFAIFACGAAGDLTQEPDNKEGKKYKSLSRSMLGLSSVLTKASLASVQTMILLSLYNIYAAHDENLEESWKILSLAMSTATSLGLHRDPGRWKLPTNEQEGRRTLFWEAYTLECSSAMSSGRPPAIPLKAIDVKYPNFVHSAAPTSENSEDGNFRFWKYEFMRRCLAPLVERFCADATPVKYHEVIEFDTRIRDFDSKLVEVGVRVQSDPFVDPLCLFKEYYVLILSVSVKIRIHLNFFARAIMDYPDNPLRSPFAHSFQVAFRGAMSYIKEFKSIIDINLPLTLRVWPLWSHTFISAVVIGTVVFRCPTFSLAEPAFAELGLAISSFRKGEKHPVVVKGLPILLKIKEKAERALCKSRALHRDGDSLGNGTLSSDNSQEDGEDDELSILQGASRIVAQKKEEVTENLPVHAPVSFLYQDGQGKHPTPHYADPSAVFRSSDPGPSNIPAMPNALSNWTMDLDALLAEQSSEERMASPSIRSATEDGAFASLGFESLFAPALPAEAQAQTHGAPVRSTNAEFDAWFSGSNFMQDNSGLFGDWNF